ncbi:MAG: hypothetical protein A3A80_01750 [Candidatus Terrybacteria bacterium RIFCSPLOWO2_01_FULL_44_24]|uniref:Uncharacterized protein n=1 Tax=Candidatus Terrybacteria bacterium RIFCSPHIGHO2_01_FULL_43_35 TaxID=1802361 RepID=A0A1G2PG56_9BACT|nr:MAG: hypothetical protein A2828_01540 [Candidatus Terrybacteria bacterium RIFCSPHIGHO2_01_FULL_43_35]OHA50809.1 MAG: hypothetical protein A3A80_01750 [Candidatus Terrybacteria bacterium RIFCSPLOWO2_01_FULL_44_24]
MLKVIQMDLTRCSATGVFIPESSSQISQGDNAITVPSIANESSGSNFKNATILDSNLATHIHDLYQKSTIIKADKTSGTVKEFNIWATKLGRSFNGMSSWWIYTSNGWQMNLAESVLEKAADLNQCILAICVNAAGENFRLGSSEAAIMKSTKTINVRKKNKRKNKGN